MPTTKKNRHRRLQYLFRACTLIAISGIIVLLLPKIEGFKYTYQKGMLWKHETLNAPFNFPIHKTAEELQTEIERVSAEQSPIFVFNENTTEGQFKLFNERINRFKSDKTQKEFDAFFEKFKEIYNKGIILLPAKFPAEKVTSVLVIKNNIAQEEKIDNLYTLKQAYTELSKFVNSLKLPETTKENITGINLNDILKPNLDYDAKRTKAAIESSIKKISPTQGMVQQGECIITKGELVTPEKYKILESFRIEHEQNFGSTEDKAKIAIAQSVLTLIAIMSFSLFLYYTRKRLFYNNKDFFFLHSMFLLTVALTSISFYQQINILIIPVLFFPIIVNILFGIRPALYLLLGTTLLASYYAPNNYMYVFMQISAGIVAIFSLRHLQRRSQLFIAVALIFLTYALVYGAFTLIQEGRLSSIHLFPLAYLVINSLLLSLVYPVLYIVERIFGYTSEISLLEFSNPNHPVLRLLTKKAPGTFQHALMVANLAEEAIYHIGGSPLLARTGALYHDIGKMYNPLMFIENQTGGLNPHGNLDFDESAQLIIEHVTKGVELANKYKLPESIIDFIRTHHGKSKVKYFYYSYKNKYPDKEVDEAVFTYPGPDPITKECAVVMMADAVEAASRSLSVKNEENISKLVNDIINSQLQEGRFAHANITFQDIEHVKLTFTEMLVNIYHARIVYPKLQQKS